MFEPSTAVSRMPASRVGALLGKRTRKAISKRPRALALKSMHLLEILGSLLSFLSIKT